MHGNQPLPGRCTSARVGVGLVIMDSSMLVATITGLPRLRQPCTMRACQKGTCARSVKSTPLMRHSCSNAHYNIGAARM